MGLESGIASSAFPPEPPGPLRIMPLSPVFTGFAGLALAVCPLAAARALWPGGRPPWRAALAAGRAGAGPALTAARARLPSAPAAAGGTGEARLPCEREQVTPELGAAVPGAASASLSRMCLQHGRTFQRKTSRSQVLAKDKRWGWVRT